MYFAPVACICWGALVPYIDIATERTREQVSREIEGLVVAAHKARGIKRFSPTIVQAFGLERSAQRLFISALVSPLLLLRNLGREKKPHFYAEYKVTLADGGVRVNSRGPRMMEQYELLVALLERALNRGEISREHFEGQIHRLQTVPPE